MGRKPRVEYYGAIYHIRYKGGLDIFSEDEDKLQLLGILSDAKELFDFKLLAYCIMEDRYDLFIKTHNISITKVMQRVNMLYARYYNQTYMKKGPVFRGRYKSNVVKNQDMLLNVVKYIHMIPVYEKKTQSIDEYKWSSDFHYRMNIEGIVDIDFVLDILALERYDAINTYKELLSKLEGEAELVKGYYDEEKDVIDKEKRHISLDDILLMVCGNESDFQLIKSGSKMSHLMKYKEDYIKESSELGFKNIDIAHNIGISDRAVRKYLLRLRGN